MNTLSDLTQPAITAFLDRIDEWLMDRRQRAIEKEIEVLRRNIDNDLRAIGLLEKEEINLRNQMFLPKGIHL
mgnify:CR=1 FL=1